MLFDELQPVKIESQCLSIETINQLANYGRKIIGLSQQSTYKYRNEHFLSKNDVERDMAVIYRLVTGE